MTTELYRVVNTATNFESDAMTMERALDLQNYLGGEAKGYKII